MTFRHGTIGNGPGKPAHRLRKCPCGEVFDMHGPEGVFLQYLTSRPPIFRGRSCDILSPDVRQRRPRGRLGNSCENL